MDIEAALMALQKKRKIFHSEADFQFALAWEIQQLYPGADIRLEYCPAEVPQMHLDIAVRCEGFFYPVELKYKTLKSEITYNGETFHLKSQGAQDIGKYDYLKDIQRLERLAKLLPDFKKGYAVLLTNDPSYWTKDNPGTIDGAFHLLHGSVKTGELSWAAHTSEGSMKGRILPVNLTGSYTIEWKEFSHISEEKRHGFRYTIAQVG